jgi:hypothetical protein
LFARFEDAGLRSPAGAGDAKVCMAEAEQAMRQNNAS